MRSILTWLGAMLTGTLLVSAAHAQYPAPYGAPSPAPYGAPSSTPYPYGYGYQPRVAPDMCNPGFYSVNHCGAVYGPNYCVYPPFPPYNGERPCPKGSPAFMTHPFARGPRDYFMLD